MTSCFEFNSGKQLCNAPPTFTNHGTRQDESFVSIISNTNNKEDDDHQENNMKKDETLDAMLSQAFNRLTFQERQEQQDLLHGVDGTLPEDKDFVEIALQELDNHLIRIKHGSVYETAEKMDPKYAGSRAFRIMFLRGNRYDAKAAADQTLRFFAQKQKLFGTEKLVKEITIDDLDEDDRACLRTGCIQIAGKDRSDRHIILQVPGLRSFKILQNELRVRYYIFMRVLEGEVAQKRGAIYLTYIVGHFRDKREGGGYLENHNLSMALPLYPAAFHVCTDDFAQGVLGNLVVRAMPAQARARFRLHFGTHLECKYHLSTYGIPGELLPLSAETNEMDLEPHLRWCRSCFTKTDRTELDHQDDEPKTNNHHSSSPAHGGLITVPNPNDVLFMGSKRRDNVGNERLRKLVKDAAKLYASGSNEDKRRLVDGIIGDIHESGGLFLKQVQKGNERWEEISLAKVREKITQRFRNHNRRRESVFQLVRGGTRISDVPLPKDVVLGRAQKSQGNELLHGLIKDRSEDYDSLNRGMKVIVVDAIIERIKSEGGRFLQPTPDLDGYVELSVDSTRDRVSTYFRNYRRPSRKVQVGK
ncbi:unnamed protein product [Cylindrotheca closterium]|uniref:DUF6824 domain-containing protein n=1 Tax=Cylindrotheca closterium TaxID=2856 RepID=A0AAD2CF06_9STRA|nr:unnamed protein product [Cylindrotheca closterium]